MSWIPGLIGALIGLIVGLIIGWFIWARRVASGSAASTASAAAPAGAAAADSTAMNDLRAQLAESERLLASAREDLAVRTRELDECRSSPPVSAVATETTVTAPAASAVSVESEPAVDPAPAPEPAPVALVATEPDDLKRVEGIGPKMAGALNGAGIATFADLAEAAEPDIRAAIAAAGLRFAPSVPTWSRQARLLAAGDDEGHAALIRTLVGGRDVSGA